MPSKILDEFLKKASPELKEALQQTRQDLQRDGVKIDQNTQRNDPGTQAKSSELVNRADVQQVNQEWQQGKPAKIEQVSQKSDLALADAQIPRNDPSKPGAYDTPKFMDEQTPGQQPATGEKADLQQTRMDLQRDGVKIDNQAQTPKRENAVDQALASSGKAPAQHQEKQKSQEPER